MREKAMVKAEFGVMGKLWDELAKSFLPKYPLPRWDKPCEPKAMRLWADRLDLGEDDLDKVPAKERKKWLTYYEFAQNTTMEEFIELNPGWPLRAFIGLMMEDRVYWDGY